MASFRQYIFPVSSASSSSATNPLMQYVEPFEMFLMRLTCGQAGKADVVSYIQTLIARQDAKQLLDIRQRLKVIA
jgi:hypothetical protein